MTDNPYEASANSGGPGVAGTLVKLAAGVAAVLIVVSLFMPVVRTPREAARRTQCKNNLKSIGLALHNYHDIYGAFPSAYTMDSEGNPLHGWRTLLLPYLDQQALYDSIDLTKPWNHEANASARATSLDEYHCPSTDLEPGYTTYLGNVAPDGCLRPGESVSIPDITDGTSCTAIVIEGEPQNAVHWMSPYDDDGRYFLYLDEESELAHEHGCHCCLADGSGHFLSVETPVETRRQLMTIDGGERLGEF